MNDQLARKYDYYTLNPERTPSTRVVKKRPTKSKMLAIQKSKIARKKNLEKRKRNTLVLLTFFCIFGTLALGLYAFSINGAL